MTTGADFVTAAVTRGFVVRLVEAILGSRSGSGSRSPTTRDPASFLPVG